MTVYTGVDAPFPTNEQETRFESPSSKIFRAARNEVTHVESSRSLLRGEDHSRLGPAHGRLNRLYAAYTTNKSQEALNDLITDVELYARRITKGRGGKTARYLAYSPTEQYGATDLSQEVAIKVLEHLNEYDPSKAAFATWVWHIAHNHRKVLTNKLVKKVNGLPLFDWLDYGLRDIRGTTSGDDKEIMYAEVEAHTAELEAKFQEFYEGLDERDQILVTLFRGGWKPKRIAKRLGLKTKAVSNRLAKLKNRLRKGTGSKTPKQSISIVRESNSPRQLRVAEYKPHRGAFNRERPFCISTTPVQERVAR